MACHDGVKIWYENFTVGVTCGLMLCTVLMVVVFVLVGK